MLLGKWWTSQEYKKKVLKIKKLAGFPSYAVIEVIEEIKMS